MSWFLIIMMVGNVSVERMETKAGCEAVRAEILATFARGSGLVDVKCVSVQDGNSPTRKATS